MPVQEINLICNDWLEPISSTDFDLTCLVSFIEFALSCCSPFSSTYKDTWGSMFLKIWRLKVGQITSRCVQRDHVLIYQSENGV